MCLCNIESPVEFLNMTSNEDQRDQQKECGCYGPFGLHSIACIHAVHNRQPSVREIVEGKAELDAALDDISNEAYLKAGAAAFATMSEKDILLAMQVADEKLATFNELVSALEFQIANHKKFGCICAHCKLHTRARKLQRGELP